MRVIVDGSIWDGEDWVDCPVEIDAWDGVFEVKPSREGHNDERILLDFAMLEYAIKVIKSAPDYNEEGGAA